MSWTIASTARWIAITAVAAVTASCMQNDGVETAGAAPRGQCFLPSQVNGFATVDDDTVHVFVGASDVYSLEVSAGCPDIDWSTRIGIRSTGGGSWVCQGMDAELIVPGDPMGPGQCLVTNVQQLDPDAARAVRRGSGG